MRCPILSESRVRKCCETQRRDVRAFSSLSDECVHVCCAVIVGTSCRLGRDSVGSLRVPLVRTINSFNMNNHEAQALDSCPAHAWRHPTKAH